MPVTIFQYLGILYAGHHQLEAGRAPCRENNGDCCHRVSKKLPSLYRNEMPNLKATAEKQKLFQPIITFINQRETSHHNHRADIEQYKGGESKNVTF